MKSSIRILTALFAATLFCSCQSYRMVGIETYNPAQITFPPELRTVMIINNAAQQPDNVGHQQINLQHIDDSTYSVSTDSMAYHFCLSLGKAISESPVFDDVRLCEDTMRFDSLFFYKKPLTVDKVERLCHEYDVDALISLDKLYFKTVLIRGQSQYYGSMDLLTVEVAGEMKAVWPGQKQAFTIPFTDSLKWSLENEPYYLQTADSFSIADIHHAIRYMSEYAGQKMNMFFVPYWTDDKRWYYTSVSSGWKRASVYANAEKWESAAREWLSLYDKSTHQKHKARLASNLALAHEITGNFPKAIEYAEHAHTLFQKLTDDDDPLRKLQQNYLDLLKKRVEDDRILTEQLRERY